MSNFPTERRVDPSYYERVLESVNNDSDDDIPWPKTKVHWTRDAVGLSTIFPPIKLKSNPASNWDQSTLPGNQSSVRGTLNTVNKTNVKKQYLLTDDDLKDLCYIDGEKHQPNYRPPQLFLKEQVLRRAWEKHGGPKGLKYAKAEQKKKRTEAPKCNKPATSASRPRAKPKRNNITKRQEKQPKTPSNIQSGSNLATETSAWRTTLPPMVPLIVPSWREFNAGPALAHHAPLAATSYNSLDSQSDKMHMVELVNPFDDDANDQEYDEEDDDGYDDVQDNRGYGRPGYY